MTDGLYLVDWKNIHAAFVVVDGEVAMCAPILRKRFSFFKTIAHRVVEEKSLDRVLPPEDKSP